MEAMMSGLIGVAVLPTAGTSTGSVLASVALWLSTCCMTREVCHLQGDYIGLSLSIMIIHPDPGLELARPLPREE